MRGPKRFGFSIAVAAFMAFAAPAGAATRTVDDDHVQCPTAQYMRIALATHSTSVTRAKRFQAEWTRS